MTNIYKGINEKYKVYYEKYIGKETALISPSPYRDDPINENFIYPIIFTKDKKRIRCSCSPRLYKICKENFDGTFDCLESIREKTSIILGSTHRIRAMSRYGIDKCFDVSQEVQVLSRDLISNILFSGKVDKEAYIKRKNELLLEGRQFVILDRNHIVSTGMVSDIYENGGNIVVYTSPKYRGKGMGKEVVKACVNWCIKREVIPIYLVEKNNSSSIGLSESLGFKKIHDEWLISK